MTRTIGQRGGRWGSPPLLVQIIALLIGALLVAQLVTLVLTLVLPPEPPRRYEVSDIAAALRGSATDRPLERRIEAGPPDLGGRGWLVSATATAGLADAIGVTGDRVVLGFYTELPVTGAVGTPGPTPGPAPLPLDARPVEKRETSSAVDPAPIRRVAGRGQVVQPMLALLAPVAITDGQADRPQQQPPSGGGQFPPGPPAAGGPAGRPGVGFPGDRFPGGGMTRPGGAPAERSRGDAGQLDTRMLARDRTGRLPDIDVQRRPGSGEPQGVQLGGSAVQLGDRAAAAAAAQQGVSGERGDAARPATAFQQGVTGTRAPDLARPQGGEAAALARPALADRLPEPRLRTQSIAMPAAPRSAAPRSSGTAVVATRPPLVVQAPPRVTLADRVGPPLPETGTSATTAAARPSATVGASMAPRTPGTLPGIRPVPIARGGRGLFGLAPAPFVEGDFVAALRLADGRWAVVTPAAEGFPSAWQRRVLLWFALSLLAVAPIAWAFARRIVGPLEGFADAAERLGRDPAAAILPLDGPAEIGRAAHAFNQMQSRLRSFVDDRTAMIGAISHDLRTPLTRLRFRIEEVPEEQHAGLLGEIEEMEAMISSVIAFMRDASTPGARERRDLAELVGDVVEDAALIGDVRATRVEPAPVDIDALGMRRVLDNLLTNAIKYGGGRARVALHVENALAVADIVDDGPGIAEAELERVFEPFYRSQAARDSEREGSGLGLAVCRSIARAHGGDVRLFRSQAGFTARVTLPLAYDGERQLAA